jgi:5-methylcytosine-specific restriction protein A
MNHILQEPLAEYLVEINRPFTGNTLASKFRRAYPEELASLLPDRTRYMTDGSAGQSKWAECPWIAIFDTLITTSAQRGYYPVLLFKTDMSGVYLSLNQGITEVRQDYRGDARRVLRLRAAAFREKLVLASEDLLEIRLNAKGDATYYEDGNITARYYPADDLPSSKDLTQDILLMLDYYEQLTYNDNRSSDPIDSRVFEKKQLRMHLRIERNTSISDKVKAKRGYRCEGCEFVFTQKYGNLGEKFIEAHHLKPISSLGYGPLELNIDKDFAVLCSNCHSMIHRLDDPSNLEQLRKLIIK